MSIRTGELAKFNSHVRARWRIKNFLRRHDERELPFWTETCIICESDDECEWHHIDYNLPFFVVKLCEKCHRKIDGWKRRHANRRNYR